MLNIYMLFSDPCWLSIFVFNFLYLLIPILIYILFTLSIFKQFVLCLGLFLFIQ